MEWKGGENLLLMTKGRGITSTTTKTKWQKEAVKSVARCSGASGFYGLRHFGEVQQATKC